jgi:hypothetical protein
MTRMKKMTGMVMLSLVGGILSLTASAQDSTKTLTVSGSVDGYYRYNFDNAPGGVTNNNTSFTNSQNSFELGMATIRVDGTADGGKVSATADLGFGRRAQEFAYTDANGWNTLSTPQSPGGGNGLFSLASIKQAYINYTPGKYITFTLGKWFTHVGYEVPDAYANRNYSMDYMFSFGPFSHTGFKAQYAKGNFGFMLGVANPTDNASTNSSVKTLIAQLSDSLGPIKAYLNYQGFFGANQGSAAEGNVSYNGLKSLNQIDLVLTTSLNSKWSLGDNFSMQSRTPLVGSAVSWYGDALYINFDPSTKVGWTVRGEYVSDNKNSLFSTVAKSFYDVTLSMNYRVGSQFTLIPELRMDGADQPVFTKADGTGEKSTVTALVAAVYKF